MINEAGRAINPWGRDHTGPLPPLPLFSYFFFRTPSGLLLAVAIFSGQFHLDVR
jgi:hypothetical protein